jgi:hypothetical protein
VTSDRKDCHYVFIVGRPVPSDPSAGHLLRLALGQQRRTGDVTVFLLEEAFAGQSSPRLPPVLADLLRADAQVLVHDGAHLGLRETLNGQGMQPGTDDDLARLLLKPGISATWC